MIAFVWYLSSKIFKLNIQAEDQKHKNREKVICYYFNKKSDEIQELKKILTDIQNVDIWAADKIDKLKEVSVTKIEELTKIKDYDLEKVEKALDRISAVDEEKKRSDDYSLVRDYMKETKVLLTDDILYFEELVKKLQEDVIVNEKLKNNNSVMVDAYTQENKLKTMLEAIAN